MMKKGVSISGYSKFFSNDIFVVEFSSNTSEKVSTSGVESFLEAFLIL
jgi:hypothetical protein